MTRTIAFALAFLAAFPAAASSTSERPNIVVVMTDDQTFHSLQHQGQQTYSALVRDGTTFTNAYVTTPLCGPSRATFFTGQYSHNNGVVHNKTDGLNERSALAVWLSSAGYNTALVGKYMNTYASGDKVPPGWDEWHAFVDGQSYYNYVLNRNGRLTRYGEERDDYSTDVLGGIASAFIRREADSRQPFFLLVALNAPHAPYTPPERYRGLAGDLIGYRPLGWNEANVSDKPDSVQAVDPFGPADITRLDNIFQRHIETIAGIDDEIGRLNEALESTGQGRNTVLIFVTDNGMLLGEHRLTGKETAYEPSSHIPLVIRGPGMRREASRGDLVNMADLTATIVDITGAQPTQPLDGQSLLPMLRDANAPPIRSAMLIESLVDVDNPRNVPDHPGFRAVRANLEGRPWKFVRYNTTGEEELYDLSADPGELDNLAGNPEYATKQAELETRLLALRDCVGSACIQ